MKFADLFCGIGGSSYGARDAGLEPYLMVDDDEYCGSALSGAFQSYFHKFDLAHPTELFWEKLDQAEVLLCSPPCQAFSTLASKNRTPTGRKADQAFAKTISTAAQITKRRLIVVENVPQFLKTDMAAEICSNFKEQGYFVDCSVRDASDFGVPQRRRRGIILASSKPLNIKAKFSASSVRDAFLNLPELDADDPLHYNRRIHSLLVMQRIMAVPKNGGSRHSLPEHLQLACHKRSNGYNDVYGRMAWDALSPTITSGCTNPSKGRFLHPAEHRAITLREAARLQTLPDELLLPNTESIEKRARMIGNAFPSRFVENLIKLAI